MNDLVVLAIHNSLISLVLAVFVYAMMRIWRNPPIAHMLWLLVLLKLVAPPVIWFDWSTRLPGDWTHVASELRFVSKESTQVDTSLHATSPSNDLAGFAAGQRGQLSLLDSTPSVLVKAWSMSSLLVRHWALPALVCVWFGGAAGHLLIVSMRIRRFEALLKDTLPVPEWLQELAERMTKQFGIRRAPRICYVDSVDVPMVWCAGGCPTIVVPMRLFRDLDDRAAAMILAHELAHLRRGDHWVRGIELLVSSLYWWNPLVCIIRRQIHHAEDLCCDAWVRCAFPDATKSFAEVLLKTAELLNGPGTGATILPASPLFHSLSLKARIEMILNGRFAPSISTRSLVAVAVIALLILPSFVGTFRTEARAGVDENASTTSEFPHVVKFEQGPARFLDGDKISILEVRGTDETMSPGNIYWIKGTYTLASHDRATLAAYTTATESGDGTGTSLKVQVTEVRRGTGKFTLYLPMSYKGWPHVSFYPDGRGESFGGNYFGTGESVMKRWWNSEEPTQKAAEPSGESIVSEFPHVVTFEQGKTQFVDGDTITILEVRGTSDAMTKGNRYWITGTYTLASQGEATLAAYTTAADPKDGVSSSQKCQTMRVQRGEGAFTLVLPMTCNGWPHLSFYSKGGSIGGIYFGTGESVMK